MNRIKIFKDMEDLRMERINELGGSHSGAPLNIAVKSDTYLLEELNDSSEFGDFMVRHTEQGLYLSLLGQATTYKKQ